jgi:hypothetical protein
MLVGPLNEGGIRSAAEGGLGRDKMEAVEGEGVTAVELTGSGRIRS